MTKLMCFEARMELLKSVQMKYHDASWSEKAKILDGFIAATDYDAYSGERDHRFCFKLITHSGLR